MLVIALIAILAVLVVALKPILTHVLRPQGSYNYHSARGSPVRSKGSVIAQRVLSLIGLTIAVTCVTALCLWAFRISAGQNVSDYALIAIVLTSISIVVATGLCSQHTSTVRVLVLSTFATILFQLNRGRIITTRFGGGTAYASSTALRFVRHLSVIGSGRTSVLTWSRPFWSESAARSP